MLELLGSGNSGCVGVWVSGSVGVGVWVCGVRCVRKGYEVGVRWRGCGCGRGCGCRFLLLVLFFFFFLKFVGSQTFRGA